MLSNVLRLVGLSIITRDELAAYSKTKEVSKGEELRLELRIYAFIFLAIFILLGLSFSLATFTLAREES